MLGFGILGVDVLGTNFQINNIVRLTASSFSVTAGTTIMSRAANLAGGVGVMSATAGAMSGSGALVGFAQERTRGYAKIVGVLQFQPVAAESVAGIYATSHMTGIVSMVASAMASLRASTAQPLLVYYLIARAMARASGAVAAMTGRGSFSATGSIAVPAHAAPSGSSLPLTANASTTTQTTVPFGGRLMLVPAAGLVASAAGVAGYVGALAFNARVRIGAFARSGFGGGAHLIGSAMVAGAASPRMGPIANMVARVTAISAAVSELRGRVGLAASAVAAGAGQGIAAGRGAMSALSRAMIAVKPHLVGAAPLAGAVLGAASIQVPPRLAAPLRAATALAGHMTAHATGVTSLAARAVTGALARAQGTFRAPLQAVSQVAAHMRALDSYTVGLGARTAGMIKNQAGALVTAALHAQTSAGAVAALRTPTMLLPLRASVRAAVSAVDRLTGAVQIAARSQAAATTVANARYPALLAARTLAGAIARVPFAPFNLRLAAAAAVATALRFGRLPAPIPGVPVAGQAGVTVTGTGGTITMVGIGGPDIETDE